MDFIIKCKHEIIDYIIYSEEKCLTGNCFLKLDKKTISICTLGEISKDIKKCVFLRVYEPDYTEVHNFLFKKNIFLTLWLNHDSLDFLIRPENEILFFHLFSESLKKDLFWHEDECYDYFFDAIKLTTVNQMMCIIQYCLKNEIFSTMPNSTTDFFNKICKRGDLCLIKICLKNLKISIKNLNECICFTVKNGNLELVKFIIESGANLFLSKKKVIEIAMLENYVDIFDYVFYPSIDSVYIKNEVFIKCMKKNNLEIIHSILSKSSFGKKWINCMFLNCGDCSSEVVELIICEGANVKKYRKSLLEKAVVANNKDLINYLGKIEF